MARVNGPLMSMSASGSVGGVVTFAHWKGRAYVRQLVKPANPKSGGQVSMRAMMKFLSQEWAGILAGSKSSWDDLADAGVFSNFNAFTKVGLTRNADFLAPYQQATDVAAGTPSVIDDFAAVAGVRSITIEISDDAAQDVNWGYLLYRSTTIGFTPGITNLIAVVPAAGIVSQFFVDTPLVADTYYYDVKPFTLDGAIGALDGEINAIVV